MPGYVSKLCIKLKLYSLALIPYSLKFLSCIYGMCTKNWRKKLMNSRVPYCMGKTDLWERIKWLAACGILHVSTILFPQGTTFSILHACFSLSHPFLGLSSRIQRQSYSLPYMYPIICLLGDSSLKIRQIWILPLSYIRPN